MNEVQWRGIESPSTEVCEVTEAPGGVHVHSIIASEHHGCEYQLETTAGWEFRTLSIATSDRTLQVERTAPDLSVTTDPQRYTRLSDREYLYESHDSDFQRTVTVDQDGLVLTYPGQFERAGTA